MRGYTTLDTHQDRDQATENTTRQHTGQKRHRLGRRTQARDRTHDRTQDSTRGHTTPAHVPFQQAAYSVWLTGSVATRRGVLAIGSLYPPKHAHITQLRATVLAHCHSHETGQTTGQTKTHSRTGRYTLFYRTGGARQDIGQDIRFVSCSGVAEDVFMRDFGGRPNPKDDRGRQS